jgi:putative endonuclease
MSYSKDIGNWAEDQATQHIQQAGWTIVKRNFHCQGGELDIVAVLADTIAFVEVKFRRSHAMGGAISSVPKSKQRSLIRAAQHFLHANPKYYRLHGRFDLICVSGRPQGQVELQWLPHIFSLSD